MIFFHPDHLGSITMVTDGQGNRIAGGEMGGASHISYKPYGEIQRNDSSGPDIFRYKYTGQEEDRETGLYYYKARYYDPLIGRFTQADSVFDTTRPMAMDLYMYTEGNPVRYRDPSGNSILSDALSKNGMGMLNFSIGASDTLKNAFFVSKKRWSDFGTGIKNVGAGVGGMLMLPLSPVLGVAYGLATNPKAFFHKPLEAMTSYAILGFDYSASLIMNPILGSPLPNIKRVGNGTIIENSYLESREDSGVAATTRGPVVHMREGSGGLTEIHELRHVQQFYEHETTWQDEFLFDEFEAELFSGTNSYGTWSILFGNGSGALRPEVYGLVLDLNVLNNMNNKSRLITSLYMRDVFRRNYR
ncbi:RHS repeat-associated core domain-containing protein [Leptospira sp. 201903071]|nr:RHS repeat-associated core domain-containing protein [Leptospira ainazelensis]